MALVVLLRKPLYRFIMKRNFRVYSSILDIMQTKKLKIRQNCPISIVFFETLIQLRFEIRKHFAKTKSSHLDIRKIKIPKIFFVLFLLNILKCAIDAIVGASEGGIITFIHIYIYVAAALTTVSITYLDT